MTKKFEKLIDKLAAKTEVFIYDGTRNNWGHSIEPSGTTEENYQGQSVRVTHVTGWRENIPEDGDRVVWNLARGGKGLFMIYDVKRAGEPRDMFFAKVVQLGRDYEGGYGWRGEQPSEPSNRRPTTAPQTQTSQPATAVPDAPKN